MLQHMEQFQNAEDKFDQLFIFPIINNWYTNI